MRIKFGDIEISEEAKNNILDSFSNNWISMGPKVKQFEEEWGKLFDYKHNVAMSSGTDAGINACATLYDLGAKKDDEIIVPALGFISIANCIVAAGFRPKFVDIERHTLNINPDKIEEAITEKTRAIMAVHTMGKPCKMDKIMEIAKKHNLLVIEDACEAHGAKYKDKYVGQFGDIALFSYYAAHLICCGEGGMASTNDERIAKLLRSIRNHGRESMYFDHVRYGLNSKMNDMEASVGLAEVKKFWEIYDKRKENLNYLLEKVEDLKDFAYFNLEEENDIVSPHAFSITLKNPKYGYKELYKFLEDNGIECKRNFGSIPTQHKAFAFMECKLGEFPEAEYVGDNGLHFGIHQYLSQEDLDFILERLHKYFEKFK